MIACPICGPTTWDTVYDGPVRMGRFPNTVSDRPVERCRTCGLQRMSGDPVDYESESYRRLVDEDPSPAAYYRAHDAEQAERLSLLGSAGLRGRVIVDVGAGAGSFLDCVRGFASRTIAIEPARHFHESLAQKGHEVFSYASHAIPRLADCADVVTSFAVIEHVDDAGSFMHEITRLAKPGGRVVLSTPNADDWLIEASAAYRAFFYRVVHRWYFSAGTLQRLAGTAGLHDIRVEFRHRFDLSNALCWLRDARPTGKGLLPSLSGLDAAYKAHVEATGRSDYLYLIGTKD
jgi:2-polyprenyl-3-methyl-5-hydroxy-6-metoxy-1,4-benzoquinol methylase